MMVEQGYQNTLSLASPKHAAMDLLTFIKDIQNLQRSLQ